MKNLFIITVAGFILSGCTMLHKPCDGDPFGKEYSTSKTDFQDIAEDGVENIFLTIKPDLEEILLITDFVDLNTLNSGSKLSFILSNSFKNELVNMNKFKIVEVELSKYFKFGKNGVRILSREIKHLLNTQINSNFALVGSYSVTDKQVLIFLKLLNLKSGLVEKSYMDSIDLTCELKSLLQKEE